MQHYAGSKDRHSRRTWVQSAKRLSAIVKLRPAALLFAPRRAACWTGTRPGGAGTPPARRAAAHALPQRRRYSAFASLCAAHAAGPFSFSSMLAASSCEATAGQDQGRLHQRGHGLGEQHRQGFAEVMVRSCCRKRGKLGRSAGAPRRTLGSSAAMRSGNAGGRRALPPPRPCRLRGARKPGVDGARLQVGVVGHILVEVRAAEQVVALLVQPQRLAAVRAHVELVLRHLCAAGVAVRRGTSNVRCVRTMHACMQACTHQRQNWSDHMSRCVSMQQS